MQELWINKEAIELSEHTNQTKEKTPNSTLFVIVTVLGGKAECGICN